MPQTLDVIGSTLASTLRAWRGTGTTARVHQQPALLPELYDIENCPYCRLVREALTELDIDVLVKPCPKNGRRFRPLVKQQGGQSMFPYLVDPNTGTALYESADIIAYLYRTWADRDPPTRLLRPFDVATSMLASGARRAAGIRARASRQPVEPLELFSFESSPFSRRVRERLCELEIPYRLRSTGKATWQDLGPPSFRRTLFPGLPVQGRNRLELHRRTGRVQVPYLDDPNTNEAMFESAAILDYLERTYGA